MNIRIVKRYIIILQVYILYTTSNIFSALTLLAGQQQGYLACKIYCFSTSPQVFSLETFEGLFPSVL